MMQVLLTVASHKVCVCLYIVCVYICLYIWCGEIFIEKYIFI